MSSVQVYVYDLSQGMARQLSPALLGKQIDGIWHTGVVVYGTEFYFGGGICLCPTGHSPYGAPVQGMCASTYLGRVCTFTSVSDTYLAP